LLVTYQSLITDENLRITDGGYLGALQRTLGLWIEEFAPPAVAGPRFGESSAGTTSIEGPFGSAQGLVWAEFVRTTDASVVATFTQGALQGWPAVTRNVARDGGGAAWYFATQPERDALNALLDQVLQDAGIEAGAGQASAVRAQPGLEVVTRGPLTFYINHGPHEVTVTLHGDDVLGGGSGERVLQPQEVAAVNAG
jgi:beta-galactosidase